MSAISSFASTVDAMSVTQAPAAASAAELAKRGATHQTAEKFEASFLSTMLQTMFKSVSTAPPFGGGPGEDMWKSFLTEAMAKQMSKRGGIGVSKVVEREMLKLQGLTETPQ
ncbi:MAG TPA: rod-binding protein [Caulobacteraceae bacterium]|jgi:Rod binding domain-containing protein